MPAGRPCLCNSAAYDGAVPRQLAPKRDCGSARLYLRKRGARVCTGQLKNRPAAFCVGAATAAAARESGLATIFEADGDVVSLAAVIAAKVRAFSGPIIHIAGARRAGDLIALLKQHGVKADRVVAYETEEAAALPAPAREAIEAEDNLSVALFSPRTAHLFLSLVAEANLTERLTRHRAACLSEPVAEIAGAANWADIGIADNRTSDAMIALLRMHA